MSSRLAKMFLNRHPPNECSIWRSISISWSGDSTKWATDGQGEVAKKGWRWCRCCHYKHFGPRLGDYRANLEVDLRDGSSWRSIKLGSWRNKTHSLICGQKREEILDGADRAREAESFLWVPETDELDFQLLHQPRQRLSEDPPDRGGSAWLHH